MNLLDKKVFITLCISILSFIGARAANYAWPANWEGVMLQGFYWDSYADTKWTNLEAQSDELSSYFKLIWVPNSGYSGGHNNMGYMPQYWFTNHNSSFGTEAELRSMIQTFRAKGTGIIEDVVVNHRNGTSNWTDFPSEQWNGQTWHIGPDGICQTDEVARQSGQARPTGGYDTGDDFDGARDLDHTNANVQNNVKNYCKFLLEDLGYAGFRYDMVKGYGGQYTKIYNEYSRPTFSVGEYWDGSYDAVAGWINATGKQSAAFDFPGKYAINEAFHNNDMTKLVWYANGNNPQPAGMIHYGYSQYAVTFVDNHDTYRDGSKFNGNVVAANAFILCSPGSPCVFLAHYNQYKSEIQQLINIRNSVGVHNNSAVKVLQTDPSCYMAEVTGSKGKLVVKIGPAMVSPAGYSDSNIVAAGTDYCIWTTVAITGGNGSGTSGGQQESGEGGSTDSNVTIYFDNSDSNWSNPYIHYWGGSASTWPGVAMTYVEGSIWKYECPSGTTGCLFNAGDGDPSKTGDFTAINGHIYNRSGDQGEYTEGGGITTQAPAQLYILGNLDGASWVTSAGIELTKNDKVFTATNVKLTPGVGETYCYFTFVTALGADWDAVNNGGDRYGAPAKNTPIAVGEAKKVTKYTLNVNASAAESWEVDPGTYDITVDFSDMTVKLEYSNGTSSIDEIAVEEAQPVYYNLIGTKVEKPVSPGVYIVVRGSKATKEYVR